MSLDEKETPSNTTLDGGSNADQASSDLNYSMFLPQATSGLDAEMQSWLRGVKQRGDADDRSRKRTQRAAKAEQAAAMARPDWLPEGFAFLDAVETPPLRPWLTHGLLMYGHVTGVIAAGGTGKSALSLHVALSVATGKPFGVWAPEERRKVLIIASEDDLQEQSRRLIAARAVMGVTPTEHKGQIITLAANSSLCLVERDHEGKIEHTKLYVRMLTAIKRYKVGLVIIDPFVEISSGFVENSNDDVAILLSILREVARSEKVAVMIVHHARKGVAAGNQDAARGASAFVNMCRFSCNLERMTKDEGKQYGVSDIDRYVRVDLTKANYAARGGTRWLQLVSVDLDSGESAPGMQSADLVSDGGEAGVWATANRTRIEEIVRERQWSTSDRAPKASRLEMALADLCGISPTLAKAAVAHAESQKWIVRDVAPNHGRTKGVWTIPF